MEKRCKGTSRCVWINLSILIVFLLVLFLISPYLSKPEITGMTISMQSEIPATVTVDFSDEVGTIREDFYGVNDEYLTLSDSPYSYLDSDCDGIKDTPVNLQLNRKLFADSKMNYIRLWVWLQHISIDGNTYNQTIIKWLMDEAEYAHSRGYRILLRTDLMPYWLQNRNCSCCNETDWNSCPPTDNTKFAIMMAYIVNNLTQVIPEEDIDVEILNEPWDKVWLNNGTNNGRVLLYADMFNITRNLIKKQHPGVSVGWTGTYDSYGIYFYRIEGLISNLTNNADFVYLHTYPYDHTTTNTLYNNLKNLSDTFDIYQVNPKPRMGFSEWNVWSGTYKFSSDRYSAETAFAYQSVLNYNPDVSLMLFEFSKFESYNCPLYPGYPLRFPMFNELDNYISPIYNVTKNFATYHSSGSMVVKSVSNLSSIKAVASKKDRQYITIINSGENASIKLNVIENASSSFKDLESGEIYTIKNGSMDAGKIEQYGIRYLESYIPTLRPETPSEGGEEDEGGYIIAPFNKSDETDENADNPSRIEDYEPTIENESEPMSRKVTGTGSVILDGKTDFGKWLIISLLIGIVIVSFIILYLYFKPARLICYYPKVYIFSEEF